MMRHQLFPVMVVLGVRGPGSIHRRKVVLAVMANRGLEVLTDPRKSRSALSDKRKDASAIMEWDISIRGCGKQITRSNSMTTLLLYCNKTWTRMWRLTSRRGAHIIKEIRKEPQSRGPSFGNLKQTTYFITSRCTGL